MRKGLFLSFLILSCVQVPSVMALEDIHNLGDQDHRVSKNLIVGQEKKRPSGRELLNDDDEEFASKHYAVYPEKAQRAKGSYGGANLVHHRPGKNAASVLQSPSVFIPTLLCALAYFFSQVSPF